MHALGFNRDRVYQFASEGELAEVMNKLASQDLFGEHLRDANLRRLTFTGVRPNCDVDRVEIRVESVALTNLVVHVNQHYQLDKTDRPRDAQMADFQNRLRVDWEPFISYWDRCTDQLLSRVKQGCR